MKKIIINLLAIIIVTVTSMGMLTANVYADNCPSDNTSKGQVVQGLGQTGNCNDNGFTKAISTAVNILSLIAGAAAVIMVVFAGFKYITSGGDSNKVANAKNTLIYALIGLAVAALAQFMVRFVLHQTATL